LAGFNRPFKVHRRHGSGQAVDLDWTTGQ
jgi:hypothetical protein